jgi:hypothetical protein
MKGEYVPVQLTTPVLMDARRDSDPVLSVLTGKPSCNCSKCQFSENEKRSDTEDSKGPADEEEA